MKPEEARREKLRKIVDLGLDPWGSRFDGHMPIQRHPRPRGRNSGRTVGCRSTRSRTARPSGSGGGPDRAGSADRQADLHADSAIGPGEIQLFVGRKQVGEANWALAECLDLGDIIGVDGELKRTKTGELTIFVDQLHFLTKTLDPPPEKYHGSDRSRDAAAACGISTWPTATGCSSGFSSEPRSCNRSAARSAGDGFVEVEGPTLHTIAGGAAARPFKTHHNALDMPLFLRIALELHLKRLLVGGIERVYELGRVYRNEGISPRHNPEFTMLEVYQAYGDYGTMMDLTEKLILDALEAIGRRPERALGRRRRSTLRPRLPGGPTTSCLPSTPGVSADDEAGHARLAAADRFRDRGQASRRDQERDLRGAGRRPANGPIFVHRLSGQHLPADQA